jgi:hypothetical protein
MRSLQCIADLIGKRLWPEPILELPRYGGFG